MNSHSIPSPPLARTLAATFTFALFAFCFFQFSGHQWPDDWGASSIYENPTISSGAPLEERTPPPSTMQESSAESESDALDQKTRWVIIDPGHGGIDGGTQGNGILEKNYALDISKHLQARLKELGIPVMMTREDDTQIKLSERSIIANKRNCAAFVSIHLNYSTVPAVSGVETFFTDSKSAIARKSAQQRLNIPETVSIHDGRSKVLAEAVQERICASTGSNNRGIKDRKLLVTLNTNAPAVLIECGFLSHAGESTRLKKESYRKEIAAAVAGGIAHFLEKTEGDPLYAITFNDPKDDPRLLPESPPTSPSLAQIPGEDE